MTPAAGGRRRVLPDLGPLRESREYRLLYVGHLFAFLGRQVTIVAVPLQVFLLTRSSLAVGLLGLAQLVPLLVFTLAGGAVADAVDRRKLLVLTKLALAATSTTLAVNAMAGNGAVWPLYVLSGLSAGLSGIDSPTRTAAIPSLVRREQLPAALALNQVLSQGGQVIGPAIGGLVIARFGFTAAYLVDATAVLIGAATVFRMRPMVPEGGGTKAGLASIAEGLRYLKGRRALQSTFVVDLNAMVFGMPRALFPALGTEVFGGGAGTVGLLNAAPGAGALVGALTTGWVTGVRRPGVAVLWAVAVWGAAIAAFGSVPWLPLALVLLAVAGAADVVSAVFRNTILQLSVPDRLRGRLSSVNIAVVTGGPRLGDVEAGVVASLTGPRFSVVSGGLACVAGVAVIAKLMPQLAAWRPPAPEEDDTHDPFVVDG